MRWLNSADSVARPPIERRSTGSPSATCRLPSSTGSVGAEQGPSVHVFGDVDGVEEEILRFDCFDQTPHYHYGFSYIDQPQVMIDPAATGDPLEWVCGRIETRLAEMLEKAQAGHLAASCDAVRLGEVATELLARGRALSP